MSWGFFAGCQPPPPPPNRGEVGKYLSKNVTGSVIETALEHQVSRRAPHLSTKLPFQTGNRRECAHCSLRGWFGVHMRPPACLEPILKPGNHAHIRNILFKGPSLRTYAQVDHIGFTEFKQINQQHQQSIKLYLFCHSKIQSVW